MSKLSDTVERKFIESYPCKVQVKTDTGWAESVMIHKTVPYEIWELHLVDGRILECADTHIVFNEKLEEVFVKDLRKRAFVMTEDGPVLVDKVKNTGKYEHMYDLELADGTLHRYYTNGILSHNSTTTIAYALWYALFTPNVKIVILAHRQKTAFELFAKVRQAYELLPKFLQAGIAQGGWNKGSMTLGNGSVIKADATSSGAIRGESVNCISGDGLISIRLDGIEHEISLHDLDKSYQLLNSDEKQRIEIKTIRGWKSFKGIKKTEKQPTIKLVFGDGITIDCTEEHLFETDRGWIRAKDLSHIHNIVTETGYVKIKSIETFIEQDVYDILEVEDCNSFLVNGISVHNCVILDEFAFVPTGMAEEFMASVFPTISSGKTTKIFIVSTPNGMNKFYEMWISAINKKSRFVPFQIKWDDIPGRDEKWKQEQISEIGLRLWNQEYACDFLSSSDTLLDGSTLERLQKEAIDPIKTNGDLRIYEEPKPGHKYAICVDVSRGLGLDYHAFCVIDVTNLPYKMVAVFQNNTLYPTILPNVIYNVAKDYNEAHVLVEISDIGQQVADMLIGDLDCENVIRISSKVGRGQSIGFGFGGRVQNGIKTSTATKKVGCADLKTLIESGNLIIPDKATVKEFMTFIAQPNGTYQADEGYHDDLVMSLTFFGWLSHQRYFRHETVDIREAMEKQNDQYLENQITPFGIFDDGLESVTYDYEKGRPKSFFDF